MSEVYATLGVRLHWLDSMGTRSHKYFLYMWCAGIFRGKRCKEVAALQRLFAVALYRLAPS